MSRTGPSTEVRRGDVWLIDLRGTGSELRGRRPAVVLQNDVGNRFSATTIVASISRRAKPLPVHVPLEAGIAGLHSDSVVNLSQIQTVDKSRLQRRLGALGAEVMSEVDRAARLSLGL